jgi:hypothetical protein
MELINRREYSIFLRLRHKAFRIKGLDRVRISARKTFVGYIKKIGLKEFLFKGEKGGNTHGHLHTFEKGKEVQGLVDINLYIFKGHTFLGVLLI